MIEGRETIRCARCELNQFRAETGLCRRCKAPLRTGEVETTAVLVLAVPDTRVVPMRTVMTRAAIQAQKTLGTMRAAEALGITSGRLKQLLRMGGDQTDYRKIPLKARLAV